MLDGTYNMTVHIPFNKIMGTATLVTDGDAVDVTLEGAGLSYATRGTCDGNTFSFKGEVSTPFGEMAYTLTGRVEGDDISAECVTKMGTYKADGKRIA